MADPKPKIGFIGVGAMGGPMAACLLKAGYDVMVFDAQVARTRDFVTTHGGQAAASLVELGSGADVVVMILPNSKVVVDVLLGDNGVARHLKPGSVVIDMTSGVPAITQSLQKTLADQQVVLLDAPVSGAVARAIAADLTIMAGGSPADLDRVGPILRAMGTVTRIGDVGSGHAMKSLNNLVSCGGFLIGIEALLIGARFGIEPETMVDVLNASTGTNNSTQKKFKQYVLSGKFDSGFPIAMMLKDLNIATGLARELDVNTPFSSLCRDMWSAGKAMLGPDADHTAVALAIETIAGYSMGTHPTGTEPVKSRRQ